MCVVSNIGDIGRQMWPSPGQQPWQFQPNYYNPYPAPKQIDQLDDYLKKQQPVNPLAPSYNGPTKEQFEEFLKLLRQAKKLDTLMGLKDCEMAEKLEWLKAIATHLGVDVKDLVS